MDHILRELCPQDCMLGCLDSRADRLEGLQLEKHLVDVKPMSDLSNWDTNGYETYLKNPALALQENIMNEGVRANTVYLNILGATSDRLVSAGLNHTEDSVDGEK